MLIHRILPAALIALAACERQATESNPAEQMILFERLREPGLFTIRPDGTGEVQLTRTGHSCARWSPDRRRIAFVSRRETSRADGSPRVVEELYVMNADGSDERRLTTGADVAPCVDWSPDGRRIVYSAAQDGEDRPGLYIIEAGGSTPRRLTPSRQYAGQPDWSPDGRSIAFTSNRDGEWKIHVINPDGTRMRTVASRCDGQSWHPVWSPGGGRFAYECVGPYGSQVHTVRSDGTGDVTVSPALDFGVMDGDWSPVWSPDGRKLAVERRVLFSGQLVVMAADGTNPVELTDGVPRDWR